ncbi:AraC family transcriptional regulator [Candidatus Stoquefichus massiliensis]|uniref:AraC family transcriptional regulator n=1 Tax=Candidatus Stoquefichus massiliensis TaxID=1470350 RepID=UPI00048887E1|nr:AraC family transcriptional regulator [Candidatus Stoquefichus massiliensis]
MRKDELDKLLRKYTISEINHKKNIKTDYSHMPFMYDQHQNKIYNFQFSHLLSNQTIAILRNERFADVPTHVHDFIEMNYMYSGQCVQIINGKKSLLKKGQMTLIDTKTPHSLGYTDENDIMINMIIGKEYLNHQIFSKLSHQNLMTSFFINAFNDQSQFNYMIFNTENNERLQTFIIELLLEYYQPTIHSYEMLNSLFVLIILEMMNNLDTSINYESVSESNSIIFAALEYMEHHYLTCTLESTAKHVNVNASYLTTLLKKYFQKSYKELIIQLKMDYACSLLLNTNETIDAIARQCNYQNLSFFYKKFRAIYHCSPKEYRNKHKF